MKPMICARPATGRLNHLRATPCNGASCSEAAAAAPTGVAGATSARACVRVRVASRVVLSTHCSSGEAPEVGMPMK